MWERWPGTVLVKPFGVGVYEQGLVQRSFFFWSRVAIHKAGSRGGTVLIRFGERAKAFDQGLARAPA